MTESDGMYEQEVAPRAASTIETMRSVGYSPETALADLIDNSITAGARHVDLKFEWNGADSVISIRDDGRGMSTGELIEAMRLGSGDPRQQRGPRDLGRFGMGLKTASFSQCRKLTVATKKEGYAATYACWDLDAIAETNRWQLARTSGPAGTLDGLGTTGTTVVWEKMDRLVGFSSADDENRQAEFWKVGRSVRDHLAMVFHRFIETGRLTIRINEVEVEPWNPFLPEEKGGQSLADETLLSGRVRVRSYVLPHLSRLTSAIKERAGGVRGMTGMQGFYVYRGERMLVAGSWLGLARRHEDTKLARLLIDISNADDEAWQIDIKKSTARPPAGLRSDLDRLARQAQLGSRKVYRHRGVSTGGVRTNPTEPVWDEMLRQGKRFYQINRKHPAVELLVSGSGMDAARVEAVLRMVEETVPVARIYSGIADGSAEPPEPLEGEADEKVIELLQTVYESLCGRSGPAAAADTLAMMEPFCQYPAIVQRFLATVTDAPRP